MMVEKMKAGLGPSGIDPSIILTPKDPSNVRQAEAALNDAMPPLHQQMSGQFMNSNNHNDSHIPSSADSTPPIGPLPVASAFEPVAIHPVSSASSVSEADIYVTVTPPSPGHLHDRHGSTSSGNGRTGSMEMIPIQLRVTSSANSEQIANATPESPPFPGGMTKSFIQMYPPSPLAPPLSAPTPGSTPTRPMNPASSTLDSPGYHSIGLTAIGGSPTVGHNKMMKTRLQVAFDLFRRMEKNIGYLTNWHGSPRGGHTSCSGCLELLMLFGTFLLSLLLAAATIFPFGFLFAFAIDSLVGDVMRGTSQTMTFWWMIFVYVMVLIGVGIFRWIFTRCHYFAGNFSLHTM
jgi:hypothetical protein